MVEILVDCRITAEAERALTLMGFDVIKLPSMRRLPEAIASHPDTLIFKYKNEIYTSADYCDEAAYIFSDIRDRCPWIRIHFTSDTLGDVYPHDCRYNAHTDGECLVCNSRTVSESILSLAEREGLRTVDTRQGYPACTTLYLDGRAAISADRGILKTLAAAGYDTLEIEEGYIDLPPYKYGFIGGACGVFRDKVYFFGSLDSHPSAAVIRKFLAKYGYTAISLGIGTLSDLGGIVFLDKVAD